MTLAPKKFITASDDALKAIAVRITTVLKEELAKGSEIVFADVVADAVLADFAGFKTVGLDDLKKYASQGQDHFARLLADEQGEVILTEKLTQMLQTFRAATDAEGNVPASVFVTEGVSEDGDVEQLPNEEKVDDKEDKGEVEQKDKLEESTPATIDAPTVTETETAPVVIEAEAKEVPEVNQTVTLPEFLQNVQVLEEPTSQIGVAGAMVLAAVKHFAEINSKFVATTTADRVSAHRGLKDALFNLFNNFNYDDFNATYTEVIRIIVGAKNDAFSTDRVLIGVDVMSVQDSARSAYVALMGVLMHATDAVEDPSIWQHVSILSTFERHNEFNQTARDNVGEYYRHVLRK